jgi:AcrR family transcriptional regulator
MAKQVEKTRGRVLESARVEFLKKGYEKASLRAIAQNAGVTTGALYVRFPNKDALFGALVSPVAERVLSFYREGDARGFAMLEKGRPRDMWAVSDEVIAQLVEYIFENRDAFSLLINGAAGSSYEHFLEELIEGEEAQTFRFLTAARKRGHDGADISRADLHVLVTAQYYAFFEIVRHETAREEALKRVRTIFEFFRPGWQRVFGG